MPNLIDIRNNKFGKLKVVELSDYKSKHADIYWICECDCGGQMITSSISLRYGTRKQCKNCDKKDSEVVAFNERIKRIWRHMKRRCYNENDEKYNIYGGRGITICDEWLNDFNSFKEWALKNGYAEDLTIDRIDVNGNYYPENCRWATLIEQNNNRRTNIHYTHNGETKTLTDWARYLGVVEGTVISRYKKGVREYSELFRKSDYYEATNQSGVRGISWDTQANKWKVRIKGVKVRAFRELSEAIEYKNNYPKDE